MAHCFLPEKCLFLKQNIYCMDDKILPVEDVFKTSGIPTYTFVQPAEYTRLLVALRTPGRGVIIEGPSGIGKTTCIMQAIHELKLSVNKDITVLSARKKDDCEMLNLLPDTVNVGTVIIDDFHILPSETKKDLSNYLKVLAEEVNPTTKLILVGINKAGDTLVEFSPDLNNRIDTIRFEANPESKVLELINKGEKALNININIKEDVIKEASGSFHIAQMLCKEICIQQQILQKQADRRETTISIEVVKQKVLEELGRVFSHRAKAFAMGPKIRREGRAPYLHLLYWLAHSDDWSIQLHEIYMTYPEMKLSIKQVHDQGYLENLIKNNDSIKDVIHYDSISKTLTIEDPKFLFYVRNLLWNKFAKQIGYIDIHFNKPYDIALSFAGENRDLAQALFDKLVTREISVFYDQNEQHRILAENVEDYLAPIYRSEAEYVVVLLSTHYPKKIWTKFESDQFKARFGENKIIPIWYSDTDVSIFDETRKYGGYQFDVSPGQFEAETNKIVELIAKKIEETRV